MIYFFYITFNAKINPVFLSNVRYTLPYLPLPIIFFNFNQLPSSFFYLIVFFLFDDFIFL
jgi:hypothetical protein